MRKAKALVRGGTKQGELSVDLVNDGDEPLEVDLEVASSPSLSVELVDAAGQPVLLPPPCLPHHDDGDWVTLAPGDMREIHLGLVAPAWLPDGDYQARYRYKGGKGPQRQEARAIDEIES